MTVYFGIPVEKEEAHRIFGISVPTEENVYKAPFLNNYLSSFELKLYYTDKGQFIIGFILENLNPGGGEDGKSFVSFEKFIAQLCEVNQKFKEAMKLAKADLSAVNIYPMESETYIVNHPEPVIISFR